MEIDATLVESYRNAHAKAAEWSALTKLIRCQIEKQLGEEETATVNGEPVVRWTHTSATRLDIGKLRENVDPALLASCQVQDNRRRFYILKQP